MPSASPVGSSSNLSNFGDPNRQMSVHYSSVTIFLFEAKDLPAMDRNGLSDPFCKFRLGCEKFRSRVIKKTLDPQWLEEFHLFLHEYESKKLEISVWDWDRTLKNEVMGRAEIDLQPLENGKTYDLWVDIKEKGNRRGSVHLSVRVNDKTEVNELAPLPRIPPDPQRQKSVEELEKVDLEDEPSQDTLGMVGKLNVNLSSISDLPSVDSEGRSVYCVLQLGLVRFQTHTVKKSGNPEWNCDYTFPVNDIHSILEIMVMDRDAKGKTGVLGCLAIPLLSVDSSIRTAFVLKDKRLSKNTKASIWLQMDLTYDLLQAAYRTFRPKEEAPSDLDRKISAQVLVNKVNQIRQVITLCEDSLRYIRGLLAWENPSQTIIAYISYTTSVCFFQLYWIPIFLLLLFLRGHLHLQPDQTSEAESDHDDISTNATPTPPEPKNSVKYNAAEELIRLIPRSVSSSNFWTKYFSRETGVNLVNSVRNAHDQARFVQHVLELMADIYERTCNLFSFTVPWLSYFAIVALLIFFLALYILPLRIIMFFLGTYEFGKGYFGFCNFELYAFLSRVHTKEEHRMYSPIRET